MRELPIELDGVSVLDGHEAKRALIEAQTDTCSAGLFACFFEMLDVGLCCVARSLSTGHLLLCFPPDEECQVRWFVFEPAGLRRLL